eukprot:gene520-biopygen12873
MKLCNEIGPGVLRPVGSASLGNDPGKWPAEIDLHQEDPPWHHLDRLTAHRDSFIPFDRVRTPNRPNQLRAQPQKAAPSPSSLPGGIAVSPTPLPGWRVGSAVRRIPACCVLGDGAATAAVGPHPAVLMEARGADRGPPRLAARGAVRGTRGRRRLPSARPSPPASRRVARRRAVPRLRRRPGAAAAVPPGAAPPWGARGAAPAQQLRGGAALKQVPQPAPRPGRLTLLPLLRAGRRRPAALGGLAALAAVERR